MAVKYVSGEERQVRTSGERGFAVKLEYAYLLTSRQTDMPIRPADPKSGLWLPEEQDGRPAAAWTADGAVLMAYPYLDRVESYLPPGARGYVDERPAPRPEPGTGPFEFDAAGDDGCTVRWELREGNRVVVRVD